VEVPGREEAGEVPGHGSFAEFEGVASVEDGDGFGVPVSGVSWLLDIVAG